MQDQLDLTGLSALLTVADRRSFTAAAAVLGVTPSAVSQTVKQLEQRLGVRLLYRTTRSVGITEAGANLLERIRPALGDVAAALESLGELQGRASGTLRLNVPQLGSAMIIEPALPGFLAAHPEVQVDIVIEDAFSDIVGQGFDAGLRLAETLEKDMVGVRVGGNLSLAVVGSPGYFAARGMPKHPKDLQSHDCIRYRQMPSGAIYKWEFDEDGRTFEVSPRGRVTTNSSELLVRAALDGLGLAQVIAESVADELRSGRLVRALAKYCRPFPGFFLYYPSRAQMPLKLRAFLDHLRSYFQASRTERRRPGRKD
jgi:DNA-binding transcriptional LysR family regulator